VKDIFTEEIEVYYAPEFDNLLLINPATIFMLPTIEGSSGRKMCVNKEHEIKTKNMIYLGVL